MALLEGGPDRGGFHFWCPGCKEEHWVRVKSERWVEGTRPIWSWNESLTAPTFSPSVLHFYTRPADPEATPPQPERRVTLCHYFITEGVIRYCGDCPHGLSGRNIKMVDLEAGRSGQYEVIDAGPPPLPPAAAAAIQQARQAARQGPHAAPVGRQPTQPPPPPPAQPQGRVWPAPRPPQNFTTIARFTHPPGPQRR